MRSSFGETLKKIREERGWTLEEMAEKLGSTKQVLSRYERGERTPKITMAQKFADILGITLEELTGETRVISSGYITTNPEDEPKNDEVRLLIRGLNKLSTEELDQATNMMKIMFAKHADYFDKEKMNNDA